MREYRINERFGTIASTVANTARSKGQRAFKPGDFLPTYVQTAPKQRAMPADQAITVFNSFAQAAADAAAA